MAAAFSRDGRSPWFEIGRIGFAVGDLHGRIDLLRQIVPRIVEAAVDSGRTDPVVVFLGDYVDRGPESAAVIEYLLTELPSGFEWRFLKGNHEAAMLLFLEDPLRNRGWLAHGGLPTLASYGVNPLPSIGSSDQAILDAHTQLVANMPASHMAFLKALERYVVIGDYAFVHAGVDLGVPIERQRDIDLFWARERFLNSTRGYSHVVVHGHTPVADPYRDYRRICVDTGAYASGRIAAACFAGDAVWFLIEEEEAAQLVRLNETVPE